MHTVSFYSFKGGVGRTMALVNVAAALANDGKRVLVVDFDLEAPGLDTYPLASSEPMAGLLEYVEEYLNTGRAPDASRFVHESGLARSGGGAICVMSSGLRDHSYAERLSRLDWNDLYERFDGYLLFEDLKAQWASQGFDYVLVDSRTGHTDVAGICTRHLPDTVALMFFPNDENVRGLATVVADIRRQSERRQGRAINTLFIASRVPNLDDEEAILQGQLDAAKRALSIRANPLLVHQYDSLKLLNQSVFVLDRPRSKLAEQYRSLTEEIRSLNFEDRDAVIKKLRQDLRAPIRWHHPSVHETAQLVEQIVQLHPGDGEIQFLAGQSFMKLGDFVSAQGLFAQAVEAGFASPEVFLDRAEVSKAVGDIDQATESAWRALELPDLDAVQVNFALRALRETKAFELAKVVKSPAISALSPDELSWVSGQHLASNVKELEASISLLESRPDFGSSRSAQGRIALALIGVGRFDDAIRLMNADSHESQPIFSVGRSIEDTFNMAMALWGRGGEPATHLFEKVVELAPKSQHYPDANFHQCLALAYHCTGQQEEAEKELGRARMQIKIARSPSMSCWSYLTVPADRFQQDLDEMADYFMTGSPKPLVFRAAKGKIVLTTKLN